MKTKLIFPILFLTLVFIQSCKKDNVIITQDLTTYNQTDNAQIKFAKILAPALANSYELRKLIKAEAMKQFDKDYDVLYQLIRNQKIGDKTVSELLSNYAESKEDFASIEDNFPLLTIFIPTVPNFSPENWDINTEIPQVAVALSGKKEVPMFDKEGNKFVIPSGSIPGFPILVIKQNERVVVSQSGTLKSSKNSALGKYSFNFVDKSFDGVNTSFLKRVAFPGGIDQINIDAYNLGLEWQRDYVYYGLTPANTTGTFRHNFSEFITSFRFLDGAAGYAKISDQTGDPGVPKYSEGPGKWTDGSFEFKVIVINNAKNGTGPTSIKNFPIQGSDLFDVKYAYYRTISIPGHTFYFFQIASITPKVFNPNIELGPWDLDSYGNAWKFIISEFDLSEEITTSFENTTTYAGNIAFGDTKNGLGFGGSATSSEKTTYTIKTTRNSDELGEAVLTFDQPVIMYSIFDVIMGIPIYVTREISTGWVSISVEPKRVFN